MFPKEECKKLMIYVADTLGASPKEEQCQKALLLFDHVSLFFPVDLQTKYGSIHKSIANNVECQQWIKELFSTTPSASTKLATTSTKLITPQLASLIQNSIQRITDTSRQNTHKTPQEQQQPL